MTTTLSRRSFLRAAGVSLALPALESFTPFTRAAASAGPVGRLVACCTTLGIHAGKFASSTGTMRGLELA